MRNGEETIGLIFIARRKGLEKRFVLRDNESWVTSVKHVQFHSA